MSQHVMLLAERFSTTGAVVDAPAPPDPVGTGVNELTNSKLTGSGTPDNWSNPFPGEGSLTLASGTLAGHQKITCESASSSGDKALLEQLINVTLGEYLTISATCRSVTGSSADPNDPVVVLNHAPFNNAVLVTARPTLDNVATDTICYYTLQVTTTGQLKIRFGLDRTGTVILEAPMVDRHNGLRNYVATDAEVPPPVVESLPYDGAWEGLPQGFSGNNSSQVRGQAKGGRFEVRRTGTIHEWHFQLASNQNDGENTKSRVGGSSPHSYPATWNYRLDIYASNSSWQAVGSPLFTQNFSAYTKDGSAAYSRVIYAFTYATHGLSLSVTKGDRLVWKLTNLHGSPEDNYVSINGSAVFGNDGINWCGVGQSPPEACGRFWGDNNYGCAFSGSNTSVISKAPQGLLAIRYSDGVEDGSISMDSTMTVMAGYIGGSYSLRQRWTYGWNRTAVGLLVYAWHRSTTIPAAPLRVSLSGNGSHIVDVDFAAASIPARNGTLRGVYKTLVTPILLGAGNEYELLMSSTGSTTAQGYQLGCRRSAGYLSSGIGEYKGNMYSPAPQSPAPSVYNLIDLHDWSGNASQTINSGSSWKELGWSTGGANLSIALAVEQE